MHLLRKFGQLLPWLFLLLYAYLLRNDFRDYIEFIASTENPFADESFVDFIGFGFWPTWLVALAVFLAVLVLAWWSGEIRLKVFGVMMATFLMISMAAYISYSAIYSAIVAD